MINEKRMVAFEAVYSDMHDVLPDALKLHRFKTEDSYSLPGLAHDYRMYCAALDSVVVDLGEPEKHFTIMGDADDPDLVYDSVHVKKAIQAAGVRVKQ